MEPSRVNLHLSPREEPEPEGSVSAKERGREGLRSHDGPTVHASRFSPQSDRPGKPHGPPLIIEDDIITYVTSKAILQMQNRFRKEGLDFLLFSDIVVSLVAMKGEPRSIQMVWTSGRDVQS